MKNLTKKIFIGCLIGMPMISNAQFTIPPPFNFGITTLPMQKIAVGNFPNNASVEAKFQVNEFLLANDAATNGNLFRTDGNENNDNLWQLFTGATNTTLTEKFRINVFANSDNTILGTVQNGTLFFQTSNIARQRINANLNNTINNHTFSRSGYMLIGTNNNGLMTTPNLGAFSMLHLNGGSGGFQTNGHHNWMRTGITFTDNDDLAYLGIRDLGTANVNEFTLTWSNNPTTAAGPDDMCFRFSNNGGSQIINTTNLLDNTDDDGLHIARFTGTGFMGMGPTFGIDNPIYVVPQSLMHLSYVNRQSVFTQYTNRNTVVNSGTRETASDGFRIGILGDPTQQRNGNAIIYQQENRHLLLSTRANTTAIDMDNTQERVRITRIGAPTNLPNNAYGQHNPAGLPNNVTRVSISQNPNNPVTRPLSLLHMGFNTTGAGNNGWRNWMDIGMFLANSTDIMYMGLKDEGFNKQDAIINWGDNGPGNPASGPDNLRFIFTSNPQVPGNPTPSNTPDGLEITRMVPTVATTLASPNYGMVGIGNFAANGPNTLAADSIDAKLDIDGDLRIRQVTQDSTLLQVLVIDSTDHNRVHWLDVSDLQRFGSLCSSTDTLKLKDDSQVYLDSNQFHFSGIGGTMQENNVGIGTNCQNNLAGKLHVYRASKDMASTAAYILNSDSSDNNNSSSAGLFVKNSAIDVPFTNCRSVAGWFETVPDPSGETGFAVYVPDGGGRVSVGFGFPNFQADNTEPDVCGFAASSELLEVNGDIYSTGMLSGPSDLNFKTNIAPITNALDKVKKLNGVYYDYQTTSFPHLNFSSDRQVGLIAQNVDTVLTEVTQYDSTLQGYTLNYDRINALLIEAIKEQDNKVDSLEELTATQDSINDDLETRLAALEQCINNSNICSSSARTIRNNSNNGQTIELSNLNAIILDQNLPNPFAENTTITYNIPDDVMEAQLLFYDMNGRIIKQVDITDRGESSLTVYGDKLEQGIYTYSLIADGKLIATKKMVKQ